MKYTVVLAWAFHYGGFPECAVLFWRGRIKKDYSILGFMLESPYVGIVNYRMYICKPYKLAPVEVVFKMCHVRDPIIPRHLHVSLRSPSARHVHGRSNENGILVKEIRGSRAILRHETRQLKLQVCRLVQTSYLRGRTHRAVGKCGYRKPYILNPKPCILNPKS